MPITGTQEQASTEFQRSVNPTLPPTNFNVIGRCNLQPKYKKNYDSSGPTIINIILLTVCFT